MRSGESLPERLTVRSSAFRICPPIVWASGCSPGARPLGMSQVVFARFLGVDPTQSRSWEQGTRPPSSMARRFMGEIEEDPAYWRRRIVAD